MQAAELLPPPMDDPHCDALHRVWSQLQKVTSVVVQGRTRISVHVIVRPGLDGIHAVVVQSPPAPHVRVRLPLLLRARVPAGTGRPTTAVEISDPSYFYPLENVHLPADTAAVTLGRTNRSKPQHSLK